jgi:hypothetical protein
MTTRHTWGVAVLALVSLALVLADARGQGAPPAGVGDIVLIRIGGTDLDPELRPAIVVDIGEDGVADLHAFTKRGDRGAIYPFPLGNGTHDVAGEAAGVMRLRAVPQTPGRGGWRGRP